MFSITRRNSIDDSSMPQDPSIPMGIESAYVGSLEKPSTSEQIARIADQVFSAIVKAGSALFSIAVGGLFTQRYVTHECLHETAEQHLKITAGISAAVVGLGVASSALCCRYAQQKESERVKKCFDQLKKETNENTSTSIISVQFRK